MLERWTHKAIGSAKLYCVPGERLSCPAHCDYTCRSRFGHIAIGVDDIYGVCQTLSDMGYAILRPPRDGHMAFVKVRVFLGPPSTLAHVPVFLQPIDGAVRCADSGRREHRDPAAGWLPTRARAVEVNAIRYEC